ncbi:Fur family transcriptional regulator [Nocardioides sp. CPCC 205120]|uniref:Fur family transcriptional regulator n=1 Tax=Nocardioides sp. CPCC 205120 TaxID=3406462 RepID=UPI003B50D908
MGDDAGRLKRAGLRVTGPRLAVLAALDRATEAGRHVAVSELAEEARALRPRTSTQTVYDCVDALAGSGLVRRVEIPGFPARYESRTDDNHHHLVCRSCGRTVDVDCPVGAAPCLTPAGGHDFTVDEAEIVFWGRCGSCTSEAAAVDHAVPEERTTR